MTNRYIPRPQIHAWSEAISDQLEDHQSSLQRLLAANRRLTRYIEQNEEHFAPQTRSVCVYMTGVIARMFELAGGRLRNATWEQVHAAERKVQSQLDAVLPLGEGFAERFRAADRAQPHLLDEAYMALFERAPGTEEAQIDDKESFKVLLLSWVVTEVLDANWSPPKTFEGEASYTFYPIEPTPDAGEPADEV